MADVFCGAEDEFLPFTELELLASEVALPVNTAYVARTTSSEPCKGPALPIHLDPGKLLVFLPPRGPAMSSAVEDWHDLCRQIGVLVACSQRLSGRTDLPSPAAAPDLVEKQTFSVAAGGAGLPALGLGWSTPEPWGTWSDGPEAHIVFRSDAPPNAPLSFSIRAHGLLPRSRDSQQVQVLVDGKPSAVWEIPAGADHEYSVPIPPRNSDHQITDVELRIQQPVTPKELGLGNDDRRLGIALASFELQSAPTSTATRHASASLPPRR